MKAASPGSYLVTGATEGRIRRQADEMLMPLFCDHGTGCGSCHGCMQYTARKHPDVLEPEGCKTDDANMVPPFLAKQPFEGGYHAVVIPRVDLMTEQAQNALLKSVEEPPPDAVILLGAVNLRAVLPTIQSRCIRVEAQPDTKDAFARLIEKTKVDAQSAQLLLRAADGDYPGAVRLFENNYLAVRQKAQQAVSKLAAARGKGTSQLEKLMDGEDLAFMLELMLIYITDVLNFKYLGEAAVLKNADQMGAIRKDAASSPRRLTNIAEGIGRLIERIALCRGLNKKLALQGALLEILEVVI